MAWLLAWVIYGCAPDDSSKAQEERLQDADDDGVPDTDDCDATDPEVGAGPTWFADSDRDGYGNPDLPFGQACDLPAGFAANGDDCDDLFFEVHPGGTEVCNRVDDDCDGEVDDGPVNVVTVYADVDGDGVGGEAIAACEAPAGSVESGGDCDDDDAERSPLETERCDGVDNDCDGTADDGLVISWYEDVDQDGYGRDDASIEDCLQPSGYAYGSGDCDDADPLAHPDAAEVFDGIDNDCDGYVDPGYVYVVERYSGVLWALDYTTGDAVWSLPGLGQMIGVATGPDGAIYVSQFTNGAIARVEPDGSASTVIASGFFYPSALWFDVSTGTLLVGNDGDGTVYEVDPSTGTKTAIITGVIDCIGAIRRPGESTVYVSARGEDTIYAYDGGSRTAIASVTDPNSMVFGPDDKIYVGSGAGELWEVDIEAKSSRVLATGYAYVAGVCLSPSESSVFFGDHDGSLLDRFDFATEAISSFTTSTVVNPWQCSNSRPADGDADGFYSYSFGGRDCDDNDATVFPGSGC
jgi:hypothetical protein